MCVCTDGAGMDYEAGLGKRPDMKPNTRRKGQSRVCLAEFVLARVGTEILFRWIRICTASRYKRIRRRLRVAWVDEIKSNTYLNAMCGLAWRSPPARYCGNDRPGGIGFD